MVKNNLVEISKIYRMSKNIRRSSNQVTFKRRRLHKILNKMYVILLFIKQQKVKKLSAEVNYSDYKKLTKLSMLGDFTLLRN